MRTAIWAHRGASAYAPENTLEAFMLAHRMQADGIELDIHMTKDGQIVVAHDETVERCSNGLGRIIDLTLEELKSLDFSHGINGYSGIRIPTLKEVLSFMKGNALFLNIEIKSGLVQYEGIEQKTVELVKKMGMENRVIYSSFNHYSLILLRRYEPAARIGLLYSEAMVDPHVYAQHLKANAIHPYFPTLMVPGALEGCRTRGIQVHPWTVNEPEHILWMLKENVDAIITNNPDVAYKIRESIH